MTTGPTTPARFGGRQRLVLLVLPAAGFTLVFGRLADLFGRRRLFVTGMAC